MKDAQKHYKFRLFSLEKGNFIARYQLVNIEDFIIFIEIILKKWGNMYDYVAIQNQKMIDEYYNIIYLLKKFGFKYKEVFNLSHNLSHAALAFYTSPFDNSLILSYDGKGDDGHTVLFKGNTKSIEYFKTYNLQLGNCYLNIGYFLGIKPDIAGIGSGKTMGLSAYGSFQEKWSEHVHNHIMNYERLPFKKIEGLIPYGKAHNLNKIELDKIYELHNQETKEPENEAFQSLANTFQREWTNIVKKILYENRKESENLCITGGCALNAITNYEVRSSEVFKNIHLIPNPTDAGLSSGAALYTNYNLHKLTDTGKSKIFKGYNTFFSPFLGEYPYDIDKIMFFKNKYPNKSFDYKDIPIILANLLNNNYIIGVIKGKYEIGPRALGNRSIFCNPTNKNMREILNFKVKHREWYRPFAPVCIEADSKIYFTNKSEIPYMSEICKVKEEYQELLPSITHVDGSCRLQTVKEHQNAFLYNTLKQFKVLSGFPVLLNTSFNPGGEPIINYCEVGLEMLNRVQLRFVPLYPNLLLAKF
jgi:carbamoyltransferase